MRDAAMTMRALMFAAMLAVALPAYAGDMLVSHGDCNLLIVAGQPSTCMPVVLYFRAAGGGASFAAGSSDGGKLIFLGKGERQITPYDFLLPLSSVRLSADNAIAVTGDCRVISKGQVSNPGVGVLQCAAKDDNNVAYVLDFDMKWQEVVKDAR